MSTKSMALVVYGEENKSIDAIGGDIKFLAESLTSNGFIVEPFSYHDSKKEQIKTELMKFDAVQVWVNPIVKGYDRRYLDLLLSDISKNGVYVSTHLEIISKIGTKEVLYSTRNMDWGGDTELYTDYSDFEKRFLKSMDSTGVRILKKQRGSSGDGIYKIQLADNGNIYVVSASSKEERILPAVDFYMEFQEYFENGGLLINQKWSQGIINGMVRCYLTGSKVSGFGYQESVALCPYTNEPDSALRPTSKRFYFSEYCGLFQDLREIMESKWVPQIQEIHSISEEMMPLLWDIDLFINDVNTRQIEEKYTLCEINVSCISPFPPSCIPHILNRLNMKLK